MTKKDAKTDAGHVPAVRGPKPTYLSLVPERTTEQRAEWIVRLHEQSKKSAQEAVMSAILCGLEMLAAKYQVGHGEFGAWLAQNCTAVSDRTARRWMALAEAEAIPLAKAMGSNVELVKRLAEHGGSRVTIDNFLSAIKQRVDGATITSLYIEHGIIAEPKPAPRLGGANQLNGWLGKYYPELVGKKVEELPSGTQKEWKDYLRTSKPNEEEALRVMREALRADWNKHAMFLEEHGVKERDFRELPETDRVGLYDLLDELKKLVGQSLKLKG